MAHFVRVWAASLFTDEQSAATVRVCASAQTILLAQMKVY